MKEVERVFEKLSSILVVGVNQPKFSLEGELGINGYQ
jgi:hypothetical protein